jgi:hypothetical protein
MKLFGIELRKATFNEITAAAVLGTGLWMVGLGFAQASGHALDIREAGALLLVTGLGLHRRAHRPRHRPGPAPPPGQHRRDRDVARLLRRRPGLRRLSPSL